MGQPITIISSPNKMFRWPLIIVSFLAIFSLAASSWLFYQNLKLQKQINQLSIQPLALPLASPSPAAPVETVSWKTYTNTKYGFSFSYPSSWEMNRHKTAGKVTATDQDLTVADYISIFDPEASKTRNGNIISFAPQHQVSMDLGASCSNITDNNCLNQLFPNGLPNNLTNFSINNTAFIEVGNTEGNDRINYVYFIYRGKVFSISLYTDDASQLPYLKYLQHQILSTFKFTNN